MLPYKIIIILCFLLTHSLSYAADAATFSNFYTTQWEWWHIAVAGVFAIGAGVSVYLSAGTAAPIVTSIGTFIGNLMGYSGVVATNAGLALLGGGAIASGGLGMAGGAAVITMALSFSTDVVKSYVSDRMTEQYNYNQFIEQSRYMSTLPLPRNTKGSSTYYDVVTQLTDKINPNAPYSSPYNSAVIKDAIQAIKQSSEKLSNYESIQIETLKSLLYMSINEYKMAKKWAKVAMYHSEIEGKQHDLARLIFVVSSLYEEQVDIKRMTRVHFKSAVLQDASNKLIPLMFSIYLDRIIYRFNDGVAQAKHLRQLVNLAMNPNIESFSVTNLTLISIRYFTLLKLEQQKIRSLTQTDDLLIKNEVATLETVKHSLAKYQQFIEDAGTVFSYLVKVAVPENQHQKVRELNELYDLYKQEAQALHNQVTALETYQQNLHKIQAQKLQAPQTVNETTDTQIWNGLWLIGGTVFGIIVLLFAFRRKA